MDKTLIVNRLADEGYIAGDNDFATPIVKIPAPVIETMTLNELTNITNVDYIKVLEFINILLMI